jgi:acetyl esterase/lipase
MLVRFPRSYVGGEVQGKEFQVAIIEQLITLDERPVDPTPSFMKRLSFLIVLLLPSLTLLAEIQDPCRLWPEGAPGALGNEEKDVPTLTPYLPDPSNATGAAVVICPGGGYGGLAPHEGKDYALWLNELGIAGFVLKYRLGSNEYRHPRMLEDAARAVRLVRAKAGDWKVDAKRVGIMGSSAGGHLASTLLTHFDSGNPQGADPIERQSSRPDLGILCYAVISMGTNTHQGSKNNLLGKDPSPELVKLLSNELQVTPQTPRCFIWHTYEDAAVKVENSLDFAAALRKAGVPFDLHIYQDGRHGIGLANGHPWTKDCAYWLKLQGFAK